MNSRIWGIIGGVALVLALLSPLVLGNSKKIEQLFKDAEVLYEHREYNGAIAKYDEALKESKKFGANTERIDIDFITLANLKIAQCYYELGEETSDVRYYQKALTHIKEVASDTQVHRYKEELTYLWAENLYKIGDLNQAKPKFAEFVNRFAKSQWVPKALYITGEINYQQQDYDEALNKFQELIEKFPNFEFTMNVKERITQIRQMMNNENSDEDSDGDDHKSEAQTIYDHASYLQQQGKVHNAYERYKGLITQYPDNKYVPHAYVGIAEIYLAAKDYVNARANYEEAIYNTTDEERKRELYVAYHRTYLVPDPVRNDRRRRESDDELFVIARLLRLEKRWLEAAETYEKLTDRNLSVEDMTYSLYWEGRCYYEAAQTNSTLFSKSVDALTTLTTDYENSEYDLKSYYYLTLVYTNWAEVSGDDSKCQSVIDTVKQADAKFTDSNDNRVQELLSQMRKLKDEASKKLLPPVPDPLKEKAKEAIKHAETAIANATQENTDPQIIRQAKQHLERAKHQKNINNYEEAIYEANKVLELLKRMPPLPDCQDYVDEGNAYLEQGYLRNALRKAEIALDLDRNCTPAHELKSKIKQRYAARGKWFFEEEKYDEAIEAFNNAININISLQLKEPHNYLGIIYIRQEKYREAIEAFSKAIRIDANFKEAYFNRALAHLELEELGEAIINAEAALRIDPNYEPARMLIEFIAD